MTVTVAPEYDSNGAVKRIVGKHIRVGKLSPRTIQKLKLEGVAESRFDFLMNDPDPSEEEEYTGVNIDDYGMNKSI